MKAFSRRQEKMQDDRSEKDEKSVCTCMKLSKNKKKKKEEEKEKKFYRPKSSYTRKHI